MKKTFYIVSLKKRIHFKQLIAIFLVYWPLIVCSQDFTETWTGSGTVWTASICDLTVTTSVSGEQNGASVDFSPDVMGCNMPNTYSSNAIINRASIAPFLNLGNNGRGILTFTFSVPVTNPVLHIDRLGGGYGIGPFSNSALLTLVTPGLTLTRLSGNGPHFEVTPKTITRTPDQLFGSVTTFECGAPNVGGASGSVRIEGTVTSVSFQYELNGADGFADAIETVWEVYCDFDQDGINDDLDLDDDNDGILDTTELGSNLTLDSDNDGLIDANDLDSDGDGCYDVIEAGFNDPDGNGILGTNPDTVDLNGLIIGESDGYTVPLDTNFNNVFDFQEDSRPAILSQSSDIISCEGDTVIISISIQNTSPIQWQVSEDNGLTWLDLIDDDIYNGVHFENLEVQNITLSYNNFLYRAQLEFCTLPILSNDITLSVIKKPNAGIDGVRIFCPNDPPEDLINLLEGNPDALGTWSPSLSQNNGIFDPRIDSAGTYTYSVDNGICTPSESVVSIQIIQSPTMINIKVVDFSNNNSITVDAGGNGFYEYSINGFDYQNEPIFGNLTPDYYTIYVRDRQGCETITTTANVIGYPRFFTPNNDGYNDYWNFQGISNMAYTVSIFDRYGKLLKTLSDSSLGWDGKFNNRDMPSSDYWFKFINTEGITKTGHFALKR